MDFQDLCCPTVSSHFSTRRGFIRRVFMTSTGLVLLGPCLKTLAAEPKLKNRVVEKSSTLSQKSKEISPEKTARKFYEKSAPTVNQGLKFLAAQQLKNGSFGTNGYSKSVAICAISGIAFLGSGSAPGRGPYGKQLDRCIQYLLKKSEANGLLVERSAISAGPMYGHGFATLFLGEVYGLSQNPRIKKSLTAAVKLIVNTQNEEGGWRYQAVKSDADISVTICQIMALRAAKNSGIHVPKKTVDKCIDYVKKCQASDGGFNYLIQGGGSSFPRSAAGVVALYSAGIYKGPELEKGLKYLDQQLESSTRTISGHFFYGQYYATQAMWHAGGKRWEQWYPAVRDCLISKQRSNGSWQSQICPEYGTAMSCIILQIPKNNIPIFQR